MQVDGHDRWLAACAELGFEPEAMRYREGTRTSQDAAEQIGCEVAAIAKSVVLLSEHGPVIVITSGANRVERKKKVGRLLGYKVGNADAEYVLSHTGYPAGGVPPFGHLEPARMLIDEDLMSHEIVWGAGGCAQTVFPITPSELQRLSGATLADVKQE